MGVDNFNPVFVRLGTTIFTVMSALAVEHDAINLGQGFPDEDGPLTVRDAAARAISDGPNQYPPMIGLPALRAAIAQHGRRFYDLDYDAASEVLVTSGATEALTASIMALVSPGDEAVIIEPAYDSYRPALEAAGATVKTVRLQPPNFRLEADALRAAFSSRTRLVMINSPLNPIGRVFSRTELELIAAALAEYDAYAICDEVYEHLVFDGVGHIPLATLPGMRERCVRVGSAGKMFSLTGWKVGWVQGPAEIVGVIARAHQFLTFTTPPALQIGVTHGLQHEIEFTLGLTRALQAKRDYLSRVLSAVGFDVLPSEGTYFVTAGIRKLTDEPDRAFCERLTREAKVTAIPLSPFYCGGAPAEFVRFAFCKRMDVLEEAGNRLRRYFIALTE